MAGAAAPTPVPLAQIPVPAATPVPMPAATPVPAPAATPSAPLLPEWLAWILEHKDSWPAEVTLQQSAVFPVLVDGRPHGSVTMPAGAKVKIAEIDAENITAKVYEGEAKILITSTDLHPRAEAAMAAAKEQARLAALVTPTPTPPPAAGAAVAAPEQSSIVSPSPTATTAQAPPARVLEALSGQTRALIKKFQPAAKEVRSEKSGLLHPGLGMTKAQLDTMQAHVRKGDQPWAAAFEQFAAQERSSLKPKINYERGWKEILRGPLGKAGNYITFRMAMDGDVAFHQILMWYITGNETYRMTALKVIRNYYSIRKVEPHWDSQIRWGIAMSKLCFVADLLRYSPGNTAASNWTDEDQSKFANLLQMGQGLITGTGYWMNQHSFATMGLMGTAVVLDDRKLYDECVERITVNRGGEEGGRNGAIKWQIRLVTENAATKEKVDPPQVQVVEMARDQGHAWINPTALSSLAQIVYNQGTKVDPVTGAVSTAKDAVDPFSFLDDRLLAGGEYLTRYSNGETVTWIPVVMANAGKGKPPQIGEEIKGAPRRGTLGVLYNFYKYVKKWDSSDPRFHVVAQTYESGMPEADGGTDFPGNGTLLYTPEAGLIP